MKKRWICLMLAAVILVGSSVFFLVTRGRVETTDGLLQNSRVYMDDIRVEDGQIYYTIVNKTFRNTHVGDKPHVQRKVNGEWQFVSLYTRSTSIAWRISPFSEKESRFTVDCPENLLPGEYRLFFGGVHVRLYDENDYSKGGELALFGDGQYIVGYFSVA